MRFQRARPGRLELPTFWFVAIRVMLNALFGVAYGPETPFFPHLAAPNPAPKLGAISPAKLFPRPREPALPFSHPRCFAFGDGRYGRRGLTTTQGYRSRP